MLKFVRALFSTHQENRNQDKRHLRHPRDLREGDIIKFGYLPIGDISGRTFEIKQVNTYLYGNLKYPEYVLEDRAGELLYLMVEDEDGEEYAAVSKKVPKGILQDFLSDSLVEEIKAKKTSVNFENLPDTLKDWLQAHAYKTVDFQVKGAFVKGDLRNNQSDNTIERDRFVSYILEDNAGESAVEVEVYESGETEVCVTTYLDLDSIEEMWPAKNETSGGKH